MKTHKFRPTVRDDGSLDPGCLERAGARFVKDWLRDRLGERDPYFPIDTRSGEDPEALVVGLVRDAGTHDAATRLISRAAKDLLSEGRALAPAVPFYFMPLLRLCQQVLLPETSGWFVEELRRLVEHPGESEAKWGNQEDIEQIVYAALIQAPGLPQSASHLLWRTLLERAAYCTVALLALGSSFELRLTHMRTWWRTCISEERDREVRQIIYEALRNEGEDRVRNALISATETLSNDLQSALDAALRANGMGVVFARQQPQPSRDGGHIFAIQNAALRREFILNEAHAG
jgi:hypothetical protein